MKQGLAFDNRNLRDRIYYHLRDRIINNEMEPGSRINYDELEVELGVSRTPLRDAINHLQQDGLIEVKPRSGTFVNTPKPKDIEEIYDVRKALEMLSVDLALPKIPKQVLQDLLDEADHAGAEIEKGKVKPFFQADRNLHKTIIQHSQNKRLIQMMELLEVQIQWFGVIITKNFSRPKEANEMHKRILRAMYNSDKEQAISLMGQHIEEIKQYTISDYSKQ